MPGMISVVSFDVQGGAAFTTTPAEAAAAAQARGPLPATPATGKRSGEPSAAELARRANLFQPRWDCVHILAPTGADAEQTNCGCGQKIVSVWACELHGDCAPNARGTITSRGVRNCRNCRTCGDYARESASPPPAAAADGPV